MRRVSCCLVVAIWCGNAIAPRGWSTTQSPRLRFEAATIRPASGIDTEGVPHSDRRLFRRANVTIVDLVEFAYSVMDFQVVGGPDWIRTERFDIDGRVADDASPGQVQEMMQALLEERCLLHLVKETRETPFFVVRASNKERSALGLRRCERSAPTPPAKPLRVPPGMIPMTGQCRPMSAIARSAAVTLGFPVVDRSGLDGLWSYELFFAHPLTDKSAASALAEAFRQQLGLTLEPGRGPLPVLVVQSVVRP